MAHHAKRLGGTALRILLQTRLGALCAASLAFCCSGLVTLATKAVFLGQLSPSESSELSEVRGRRGGEGGDVRGGSLETQPLANSCFLFRSALPLKALLLTVSLSASALPLLCCSASSSTPP